MTGVSQAEQVCPFCDRVCANEDYLMDHLTDDHDAISWVAAGAPLPVEGNR